MLLNVVWAAKGHGSVMVILCAYLFGWMISGCWYSGTLEFMEVVCTCIWLFSVRCDFNEVVGGIIMVGIGNGLNY